METSPDQIDRRKTEGLSTIKRSSTFLRQRRKAGEKKKIVPEKGQSIHKQFSSPRLDPEKIEEMYLELKRKPLDEKEVQIGQVYVVAARCKECSYCWEYCPEDVLEISEDINSKGYHYPQIAEGKDNSCVMCNMCQNICPEFAIFTKEKQPKEEIVA